MLNGVDIAGGQFPRTRYLGSKRKLAAHILRQLRDIPFTTVLDAFGGTGAVAHALKRNGKQVIYNDHLAFNHQIGLGLIENDSVRLTDRDMNEVHVRRSDVDYDDFVERTFHDIYYTKEENRWLDTAAANIRLLACKYKRALAWYALFQSAMIKRPYNLFHRKNLYLRQADVPRGFGNKASWDLSFDEHFATFAVEANRAVIDGGGTCRAICRDVLEVEGRIDLVYIDPPYINRNGVGTDYRQFYHFLEGLTRYPLWAGEIDFQSKHRRLRPSKNPWTDPREAPDMFSRLFERFGDSILVVSYRSEGIPAVEDILRRLRDVKRNVQLVDGPRYQYALSTNRASREVLLIGA